LRIPSTIAASSSKRDFAAFRMRMRGFFSPEETMRWMSGGNGR
jgi:hypothetical protein